MSTIIYSIRVFSIASIIAMTIQSICYARFVTTVEEISLQCAPSEEEAISTSLVHLGERNTYLSITTKGIRIAGEKELVTPRDWDWDSVDTLISAECTILGGATNAMLMFSYLGKESNTLPTLSCNRGEGIKVTMYKPNSIDPNEYQYVADLKIDRMVRKKNTPSNKMPQPSINSDLTVPQALPILPSLTTPVNFLQQCVQHSNLL